MVIIGTPPVLLAPTARIVVEEVDVILLIVQSHRTGCGKVEKAVRLRPENHRDGVAPDFEAAWATW